MHTNALIGARRRCRVNGWTPCNRQFHTHCVGTVCSRSRSWPPPPHRYILRSAASRPQGSTYFFAPAARRLRAALLMTAETASKISRAVRERDPSACTIRVFFKPCPLPRWWMAANPRSECSCPSALPLREGTVEIRGRASQDASWFNGGSRVWRAIVI